MGEKKKRVAMKIERKEQKRGRKMKALMWNRLMKVMIAGREESQQSRGTQRPGMLLD